MVVARVQPNSDAAAQGVKQGDILLNVDGTPAADKTLADLQNLMNTSDKLVLTVQRGDATPSFSVAKKDPAYVVRTVYDQVIGTVGYVRISAFYENTPDQFRATISSLMEQGVTGLVFDLRGNAGGSPEAVQEMLGYVMPIGVYGTITDVNGNVTKLSTSVNNQLSVSTVTLVNSGTAGEAEFFAGVLQDAGFTTVVGQTTAGKAKYQDFFTIESDYSAVKLTVGSYGLMKSGSWQDKGIVPSVVAELPPEQASIYQLLSPEDDAQVKVALDQITDSDLPTLQNSTTTTAAGETTTTTAASTTAAQ